LPPGAGLRRRRRILAAAGAIGELAENAYSFVGAAAQTPLLKKSAPKWAEMIKQQGIEAMILLPA